MDIKDNIGRSANRDTVDPHQYWAHICQASPLHGSRISSQLSIWLCLSWHKLKKHWCQTSTLHPGKLKVRRGLANHQTPSLITAQLRPESLTVHDHFSQPAHLLTRLKLLFISYMTNRLLTVLRIWVLGPMREHWADRGNRADFKLVL